MRERDIVHSLQFSLADTKCPFAARNTAAAGDSRGRKSRESAKERAGEGRNNFSLAALNEGNGTRTKKEKAQPLTNGLCS